MRNDKYGVHRAIIAVVMLPLVLVLTACSPSRYSTAPEQSEDEIALTRIPPGELAYYPSGEYLRNGYPAVPPQKKATFEQELKIATYQITQAEYGVCVRDGACKPLDRAHQGEAPDLPAVGVSWRDATAYAQWLSGKTGRHYRLPTYLEWVYAAGSAYKEDTVLEDIDVRDPAQRWLAEYALETQRKKSVDATVRTLGEFGANDRGVQDMAGNVWEWTDTCHVRQYLDDADVEGVLSSENCGVRVVAGAHRSYIPDFIRDAKSGACSVGVPPSNLGFRLVLDTAVQAPAGAAPSLSLRERLGLG